ncbi:hypothetical protein NM208_g16510 [Fusarium decemcellulare]|uniref:Uncharacterized protein n=1 Tax=Fusarium decemcellulare TaxID=57161 RepID=A0ACC1RB86_9HYPO|nr:hypothetical protein NM208_g16510 [Fusarium decemcellulare]
MDDDGSGLRLSSTRSYLAMHIRWFGFLASVIPTTLRRAPGGLLDLMQAKLHDKLWIVRPPAPSRPQNPRALDGTPANALFETSGPCYHSGKAQGCESQWSSYHVPSKIGLDDAVSSLVAAKSTSQKQAVCCSWLRGSRTKQSTILFDLMHCGHVGWMDIPRSSGPDCVFHAKWKAKFMFRVVGCVCQDGTWTQQDRTHGLGLHRYACAGNRPLEGSTCWDDKLQLFSTNTICGAARSHSLVLSDE